MRDHRELLREVDREDPPNLWPDISARTPRDLQDRVTVGRRLTAGLVAAAVAVSGIGLALVAFDETAPPPARPARALDAPLPPAALEGDPRVVGTVPLPGTDVIAGAIAAGDGSTWLATTDSRGETGTLLRLDGLTSEVTTSITLDFPVFRQGMHVAGGSLWVVPFKEPRLLRYDAVTGALLDSTSLWGEGVALDVDHDAVWVEVVPEVFDPERPWSAALVRLDAATLDVEATISLNQLVTGYSDEVHSSGDFVWVMGQSLQGDDTEVGGPLVKVSRSSNEVVETFDVHGFSMLPTADEVWVRATRDGIFDGPDEDWQWLRVDADSGLMSVVSSAKDLAGLVIDDGEHLWFVNYDEREHVVVTKAERSSFEIVSQVEASASYYTDVAFDAHTGQLWIAGMKGVIRVDLTGVPQAVSSPPSEASAQQLEGVPFPVCSPRSIVGNFGEDFGEGPDTVWVVRREAPDGGGCDVTQPFTWIGVGTADRVAVLSEAIPDTALVTTVPWPYATPDLNGDGIDEIALGIAGSGARGWVDIKLFQIRSSRVEEILWTAGAALDPSQPVTIGSTEGERQGMYCGTLQGEDPADQPPSIVTWSSGIVDGDTVRAYRYAYVDGQLKFATSSSWNLGTASNLPADGGDSLCGSPVFVP